MTAKIRVPTGAPPFLTFYNRDVGREIDRSRFLDLYTVATLPDPATNRGLQIQVTDEAGGEVPAFSDGVNWRRVTDRIVVS